MPNCRNTRTGEEPTERQLEIMFLLLHARSEGRGALREVADQLRVSWKSVEAHRTHYRRKISSHGLADDRQYYSANKGKFAKFNKKA
jgi:hypothetical protein